MKMTPRLLAILTLFSTPVWADSLPREQVDIAVRDLVKNAQAALKSTGVPGIAVAVVFEGKVLLAEGFGVRAVGSPDPVNADTVFQLASLSKPVGSTVVAGLVGKGVVSWDSRISDLDPAFEMFVPWVTRELTIRDLYAHRSGLPDHAGDKLEDMGYSRTEVLHRLRFQPPSSSFRSSYAYTNFGLTEAALAAAMAAGKDWSDLSDEILYRPLGMNSTSSRYSDFEKQANRALGHQWIDGKWKYVSQRQPDAQSPAGGVSSSVNDLTHWMQLQIDGGKFDGKVIIDETALAATHDPIIFTGRSPFNGLPSFYGLGWCVSYDMEGLMTLSHSGAFSMGAATFVGLVPAKKLGIIILTNTAPIGLPEVLGRTFLDQALTTGKVDYDYRSLFKKILAEMSAAERSALPENPPKVVTPMANPATYVGTYFNDFYGPIEITAQGKNLTLHLGPQKILCPLKHWDRDTFTYPTLGENSNGHSAVTFTMSPNGKAGQVTIENLNPEGLGTFVRREPSAQPESKP